MVIRRCELEVSSHEGALRRTYGKDMGSLGIRELRKAIKVSPLDAGLLLQFHQRWFVFSELLAFAVRLRHNASS